MTTIIWQKVNASPQAKGAAPHGRAEDQRNLCDPEKVLASLLPQKTGNKKRGNKNKTKTGKTSTRQDFCKHK